MSSGSLNKAKVLKWLDEEIDKYKSLKGKYREKATTCFGLRDISGTNLKNWSYCLDQWAFLCEVRRKIRRGDFS